MIWSLEPDAPRRPTLRQLAISFAPFGALLLAALLAGWLGPSLQAGRAKSLLWLSLVMAGPALFLYALNLGRPLPGLWRLFWTLSYVAYLGHFYYGFVVIFHGDPLLAMAHQGMLVALSNFLVTGLWGIDVGLAWATRTQLGIWRWVRALVHLLVFSSFFVAAVLFRDGAVRFLGVVLTAAVAVALILWATGRSDPEAIVAAGE